jgi:hypothetical protein
VLFTASIADMLQQVFADVPFWVLFVAPGVVAGTLLCVICAAFAGANESNNFKDGAAGVLSAIAIFSAFIAAVCNLPPVFQSKGLIDGAWVFPHLLSILTNIAALPLTFFTVAIIFDNIPKLLRRVEVATDN